MDIPPQVSPLVIDSKGNLYGTTALAAPPATESFSK
jgi:hypothetical protein